MRKVVSAYFLSLDGVAESPDQFVSEWDEETDASGATLIATHSTRRALPGGFFECHNTPAPW